jgi:hypothetical protein
MGDDATVEYMAANCQKAKRNIDVLKIAYPQISWLSVAPFDIVVQRLLAYKLVSIDSVLKVDFEIGDECDGLLCHLWEPSGGAKAELARQEEKGKVCYLMEEEGVSEIWKTKYWGQLDTFVTLIHERSTRFAS